MFRPDEVNILSDDFKITYFMNRKDVDPAGGEVLYGHIEDYKGEIRIFDSDREGHRTRILFHEVFHAICDNLNIKVKHVDLDRFAVAWADTALRNGWLADTQDALRYLCTNGKCELGINDGEEETTTP